MEKRTRDEHQSGENLRNHEMSAPKMRYQKGENKMTEKEATAKLLRRLPKKYRDRVDFIEPEDDLIDDCKLILK